MKDMTKGSPLKLILLFALPMLLGNLLQQLYNIADAAIVGRFLGAKALAAVGATSSVQFLILGFCIGSCTGFCVPIARQFGAKNYEYLRSLLSAADQAVGAMEHDTAVKNAVYQTSAAVNGHSTAALDNACVTLSSLLLSTGADVSQSDLDALMAERRQLNAGANDGVIEAPEAGVFTAAVDGFEALTPDMLDGITPEGVRGFASEKQQVSADAFGKLITAKKWYYAAVMSAEDAERLSPGAETTLDFGRHSADALPATVRSISEPVNGEVAVVFTVKSGVAETAALRETGCEIVFSSYTGLRVPLRAIRFIDSDEGQVPVVYVITAERMEMKRVEILYRSEDYVILARGTGKDVLRAGNEVIVDGKGLEDGKAIIR